MKIRQKSAYLFSLFLSSSLVPQFAHAVDNESLSTQELLVSKLERVYSGLAPADPSKVPVALRLADLLAERIPDRTSCFHDPCINS